LKPLPKAPVLVSVRIAPDLPPAAVDADALTEALLNLLDNAVKYSPENKTVQVDLEYRVGQLRLAVKDQGIGITQKEQEHIFEKFYRAEDEFVRQAHGTGVGLAIVKHIVTAHKGSIEITSRPGRGATFAILLPPALGRENGTYSDSGR